MKNLEGDKSIKLLNEHLKGDFLRAIRKFFKKHTLNSEKMH